MDTIGDFCTCIRNALTAGREKVDVPNSRIRKNIAEKLKQYGYIRGYRTAEDGRQGIMRIYLKYDKQKSPGIRIIQRVSKPSRRCYVKAEAIPPARSNGLMILSTSRGVLSGFEAKTENVGGEVLCRVW